MEKRLLCTRKEEGITPLSTTNLQRENRWTLLLANARRGNWRRRQEEGGKNLYSVYPQARKRAFLVKKDLSIEGGGVTFPVMLTKKRRVKPLRTASRSEKKGGKGCPESSKKKETVPLSANWISRRSIKREGKGEKKRLHPEIQWKRGAAN